MNKLTCLLALTLLLQTGVFAQNSLKPDTTTTLQELVVTAFEQNSIVNSGSIVSVIDADAANRYHKTNLVHAFNALAGVKMEERSPGSYRINIRGSSLRSPFGVRNVKVYWNDMPVTDPGGNTYINQFANNNINHIEIFKGPAGSMYGAGTGGLLLMHGLPLYRQPSVKAEYITGSYGLQHIMTTVEFGKKDSHSQLTYAHQKSNGYRNHSASKRDNVSFISRYKISEKQQLTASFLYNHLFYETPGGLTATEYQRDPKQARPAAGGFPSADAAKAAIYQKNMLVGFSHLYQIINGLKNTTTLYGSFAQIQNPTFRNYEKRNEPSLGARTSFNYVRDFNRVHVQIISGAEWQEGFFKTQVFKNKNGNSDTIQTDDDIRNTTYSFFTQADISIKNVWVITAGASINKSKVQITRLNKYPVVQLGRTYQNEISPRLALQRKLKNNTVFASVSRGFSPPTISELLPSTGVISTFLEAEQGINYELGNRMALVHGKLYVEATAYYFRLNNALVSRKDSSNADYFVNAGNTNQKGIELSASYHTAFVQSPVLDVLQIKSAYTYNDYQYGDFKKGKTDFSGKRLPSVPAHAISVVADLQFKKGFYCNSTWYYASKIFLDDANTVAADAYHILGSKVGWKKAIKQSKYLFDLYAGVDNLLDETYSLGNDINAAGGRYFNAAPRRNFFLGFSVQLNTNRSPKN